MRAGMSFTRQSPSCQRPRWLCTSTAGAGDRGTRCSGRRTIGLGRKSRSSRCWRSMLMYAPRVRPRRRCSRRRSCPVPRPDSRRRSMGGTVCRACSSSNHMRRTSERIGAGVFRGCEAAHGRVPGWDVRRSSRDRATYAENRIALEFTPRTWDSLFVGLLRDRPTAPSPAPRSPHHRSRARRSAGLDGLPGDRAPDGRGANRSLRPSVSRRLDGVPPPETPGLRGYADVAARPGDGRPRPYSAARRPSSNGASP